MKPWLLVGGAFVITAFAWYAFSPLFMHTQVDDPLPVVAPAPTSTAPTPPSEAVGSTPASAAETPAAQTSTSDSVPVVPTALHPASGQVRIVTTGAETTVRYENYQTINGPDLLVYLAKDLDAKEYVNLGPIKGTAGNINYAVPAGVNIDDYRYVLTWCEDFAVLFNSADLWANRAH